MFAAESRERGISLSELETFYSELERRAEENVAIYDGTALLVEIEFVERADDRLSLVARVSREYFGAAPDDIRSSGPLYRFEIPINPVEPEIRLPVMSSSGLDVEGRLYDLVISEATMTDLTGPVLWSSSEPAAN